jgi:hypothetical protein
MALKCIGNVVAIFLGLHYGQHSHGVQSVLALLLLEFPCFIGTTVYSLVLFLWLAACYEVLPRRYATITRVMKYVLVGYNVIIYFLFIVSLVIAGINTSDQFGGPLSFCRDFVLTGVFSVFLVVLHLGLKVHLPDEHAHHERRLVFSGLGLSTAVLCRGLLSLIQGLVLLWTKWECNWVGFIMYALSEFLTDGLPLFFLIKTNNDFLIEQHLAKSSLAEPMLPRRF